MSENSIEKYKLSMILLQPWYLSATIEIVDACYKSTNTSFYLLIAKIIMKY
jgi:hypothetical protein